MTRDSSSQLFWVGERFLIFSPHFFNGLTMFFFHVQPIFSTAFHRSQRFFSTATTEASTGRFAKAVATHWQRAGAATTAAGMVAATSLTC